MRKSYFTLMEILVVLMLLGLGAAAIGFQIKGMVQEQRYLTEINQVVGHLRMAQDLMILTDGEVHFKMTPNDNFRNKNLPIEYWIELSNPDVLLSLKDRDVLKRKTLKGVLSYDFKPEPSDRTKDLDILFSLGKQTTGILTLSPNRKERFDSHPGDEDYQIQLVNYPTPIEATQAAGKSLPLSIESSESERLYPSMVTWD